MAAKCNVVDFETLQTAALLAPPAISFENLSM